MPTDKLTDERIGRLWREAADGDHGDTTAQLVAWFARAIEAEKEAFWQAEVERLKAAAMSLADRCLNAEAVRDISREERDAALAEAKIQKQLAIDLAEVASQVISDRDAALAKVAEYRATLERLGVQFTPSPTSACKPTEGLT